MLKRLIALFLVLALTIPMGLNGVVNAENIEIAEQDVESSEEVGDVIETEITQEEVNEETTLEGESIEEENKDVIEEVNEESIEKEDILDKGKEEKVEVELEKLQNFSILNESRDMNEIRVNDFEGLKEAIENNKNFTNPIPIYIENNMEMKETIQIDSSVVLRGEDTKFTLNGNDLERPMFEILNGEDSFPHIIYFENIVFENNNDSVIKINVEQNKGNDGNTEIVSNVYLSLDNTEFRNNNAENGAAINVLSNGWVFINIDNSIFENNIANNSGGAIYSENAKVELNDEIKSTSIMYNLINNKFNNNTASNNGGAIYHLGFGMDKVDKFESGLSMFNLTSSDNSFSNNESKQGGAIALNNVYGAGLNINNSDADDGKPNEFVSNIAEKGGAIYLGNMYESMISISGRFDSNTALLNSGDYALGGAIYLENLISEYQEDHNYSITDADFINNKALGSEDKNSIDLNKGFGGAIFYKSILGDNEENNKLKLSNIEFKNNHASQNGGAIGLDVNTGDYIVNDSEISQYENIIFELGDIDGDSNDIKFIGNTAGNGAFPIDKNEYINLIEIYNNVYNKDPNENLEIIKEISDLNGVENNTALNNYDISFVSGFKVKYNGNGSTSGTVPVDNSIYNSGDSVTVLKNIDLEKEGYSFIGWNTSMDGTGNDYNADDIFTIDKNITLFAKWEKNKVPVEPPTPIDPVDPSRPNEPEPVEPSKPVEPDTSKPELNKKDHFGYMIGYKDGTFRPNDNITKAETATIFFRMLEDSSRNKYWSTTNDFKDVKNTAWYNNALSTLANAKIIEADKDGNVNPNANTTRAELAVLLTKFFDEKGTETHKFTDIKGHWAESEIAKVAAKGWIEGYTDGSFKPDQAVTRAEAVKMINKVLERTPDKNNLLSGMIEFKDNQDKSKWYYAEIQEATNSHEYTRKDNKSLEIWTKLLPMRDWAALEKEWSKAN